MKIERSLISLMLLLLSLSNAGAGEPQTAHDFYERGLRHETAKRYADALSDLSKAIELDPKFAAAYFSRSSIYSGQPSIQKRDYSKAVEDLTKLLELTPRVLFSARFNRALCYESLREYDKAINDYSKAMEQNTDFSRQVDGKDKSLALTHHYRGRAYQSFKQDNTKAVADFSQALRLDPQIQMVHYRRGQAHNALKQYAKAEADFAIALERDSDYPNLLCAWAWQLATCPDARFRNGDKALRFARKAHMQVAWQVDTLAAACAEKGQFEEAVRWQEAALDLLTAKEQDQRQAMEARLALYEARKPYRAE